MLLGGLHWSLCVPCVLLLRVAGMLARGLDLVIIDSVRNNTLGVCFGCLLSIGNLDVHMAVVQGLLLPNATWLLQ